MIPLMMFMVIWGITFCAYGQDPDMDEEEEELYIRPDLKVYTSLSSALANADSAYILQLKGKKLKEIPDKVFDLPNLLVLDLSKNKLKVIPDKIGNLTTLQELDLTGNKLSSVPGSIGKLKNLRKLTLNRNLITELPPEIARCGELQILEMWDNELEGLPPELGELRKLRIVELRGILFSKDDQSMIIDMLPHTRVYMSPPCNCK